MLWMERGRHMSLFKRLFGGSDENGGDAAAGAILETEHEGYSIRATPRKEGARFRLRAVISKEVGGLPKEHILIRADLFSTADEAARAAVRKARQVIGEQGDGMFD